MPVNSNNETASVLIASDDRGLHRQFREILCQEFALAMAETWQAAIQSLGRHRQDILMLDPALIGTTVPESLAEISASFPDTRIIIIELPSSPALEQVSLFEQGVHGFCKNDISPELLVKAAHAVSQGELWMPRNLITQIIDTLGRNRPGSTDSGKAAMIECLTPRELEVAHMIRKGGNNKTIARKLEISERTVKAHLSAIFRKLNIENRLHLALYFTDQH